MQPRLSSSFLHMTPRIPSAVRNLVRSSAVVSRCSQLTNAARIDSRGTARTTSPASFEPRRRGSCLAVRGWCFCRPTVCHGYSATAACASSDVVVSSGSDDLPEGTGWAGCFSAVLISADCEFCHAFLLIMVAEVIFSHTSVMLAF